jgi:hypothetical protein
MPATRWLCFLLGLLCSSSALASFPAPCERDSQGQIIDKVLRAYASSDVVAVTGEATNFGNAGKEVAITHVWKGDIGQRVFIDNGWAYQVIFAKQATTPHGPLVLIDPNICTEFSLNWNQQQTLIRNILTDYLGAPEENRGERFSYLFSPTWIGWLLLIVLFGSIGLAGAVYSLVKMRARS